MVDLAAYVALQKRPSGRPVMRQRWRSLLFLHYSAGPDEIQALLPAGLTIDTFPDASGIEKAWIGLVPFRMEGVTPVGVPEIPGIHAFPETNVRTYVHRNGKEPGVWFFSLEASNAIACRVARRLFHLPYHEAKMTVEENGSLVRYRSTRRRQGLKCNVDCQVGQSHASPEPGSLEFFLVERYLLYSARNGALSTGRVHHRPYEVSSASAVVLRDDLVRGAGIKAGQVEHVLFSKSVDVDVFRLTRLTS